MTGWVAVEINGKIAGPKRVALSSMLCVLIVFAIL